MTFDKKETLQRLRRKARNPVFAIYDGNYLVHRALHAYPPVVNSSGISVGAVLGALHMICGDYSDLKPDYLVVSFDVPGRNFRHSIDENYKFADVEDPSVQAVYLQVAMLSRLLRLIGIPVIGLQGVESDDVIGSLAYQAEQETLFGFKVNTLIFSGDKDLCQFVTKRTYLCDTKVSGGLRTPTTVKEKYGVPPNQIADYLALMGDANDGISGLPGCGAVKARKLLALFGSVQAILDLPETEIPAEYRKLLTGSGRATLLTCYKLTKTLTRLNVAKYLPFKLHPCHKPYLLQALKALGLQKIPSLVTAQLNNADLAGASIYDDGCLFDVNPLVMDDEFADLAGSLWQDLDKLNFSSAEGF